MYKEVEETDKRSAAAFKDNLFAHALVNQNPEMFFKLYPADFGMSDEDEAKLEFEVPESPADFARLMDELRETGWGG
jgi:hypothetical protein